MFVQGVDSASLATMTMETVAQDYERLRAHLGLERIAMVGHSICGLFSLEYARAYPEHVSHVVMIGTPPGWNSSAMTISREYWREHASDERKAVHERNRERFTPDSLARLSPQAARWASWLREQPWYFFDFEFNPMPLVEGAYYPIEGEGHLVGSVLPEYELPSAEEIKAPIFLALGRHDYVVPPPIWDGIRAEFEDLTTVVFERSGHFPHFEEQDLFDERLLEWLSRR
jgi:proline iminopeptidase